MDGPTYAGTDGEQVSKRKKGRSSPRRRATPARPPKPHVTMPAPPGSAGASALSSAGTPPDATGSESEVPSAFLRSPTPESRGHRIQDMALPNPPPSRSGRPGPVAGPAPKAPRSRDGRPQHDPPQRAAAGPSPGLAATSTATAQRSRAPRLARAAGRQPVEVAGPTPRLLRDAGPEALAVTYWFDAGPDGEPYDVHVHLAGRLRGSAPDGHPGTFSVVGTVEKVLPGSGRVALTVRVPDLPVGTWDVTATPVEPAPAGSRTPWSVLRDTRLPTATASGTTTLELLARHRAPGVRIGAWPALVATGAGLALLVQSVLAAQLGLPRQQLLLVSGLACLLGLVGAKVYYVATHRSEPVGLLTTGMSVQGFVIVAVGVLLAGTLLLDLPVGSVLDVTAPGLLVGMTVGRLGCLLGGCCVGRPTASRWGVWSSDRRLGMRRIPVQLMESTLAGVLAVLTLLAVLIWGTSAGGLVFVAGVAAYTAGRQLLFPLRRIARATSHGRVVTLVLACAALLVAALVAII